MMRTLLVALPIALAIASSAQPSAQETRTGFLIPTQCQPKTAGVPQPKGSTDAWPAPHTTDCALEPACIKSGYGLWVEDQFYRFDEKGQQLALAYFETTPRTSYNKVAVTGAFEKGQVAVRFLRMVD